MFLMFMQTRMANKALWDLERPDQAVLRKVQKKKFQQKKSMLYR